MKSSFENRLTKVENAIEKKINPISDETQMILVNVSQGETNDQKFAEREKELGCKLNRSKVIFLKITGLSRI
jgi:hypothetical protein